MKIRYTDGPDKVDMGMAGGFKRGEFREIPDAIAMQILAKQSLHWETESKTQPAFAPGIPANKE